MDIYFVLFFSRRRNTIVCLLDAFRPDSAQSHIEPSLLWDVLDLPTLPEKYDVTQTLTFLSFPRSIHRSCRDMNAGRQLSAPLTQGFKICADLTRSLEEEFLGCFSAT